MSTETGSTGEATAAYAHHKEVAAALSAAAALAGGKDGQLAGVGQLLEQALSQVQQGMQSLQAAAAEDLAAVEKAAADADARRFGSLEDLEAKAKPLLPAAAYNYYSSGADTQTTLRDNLTVYARYRLLPKALTDVSVVDTGIDLLGTRLRSPVLVAPMAMQKMCHREGELAMARAASASGTAMILSTMSTCSITEVAETGAENLWFQVYVMPERRVTAALLKEAAAAGYKALVVTVDTPRPGKTSKDERNKFGLPKGLTLANLDRFAAKAAAAKAAAGGGDAGADKGGSKFGHLGSLVDASLTWDIIAWMKSIVDLPVLVKGVLAPDDARRAVEAGADGIIVSNHGGRQLDFAPCTIDMLPYISAAVAGRVPIIVDGGVRRGSDVAKCLALGATAVLVGRPMLWALALDGQAGVERALEMVRSELELCMALLGCPTVGDLTPDRVLQPPPAFLVPESRR